VALCFACHGAPTMGAHTDVVDGVYEGLGTPQALRGGGFLYAFMDTECSLPLPLISGRGPKAWLGVRELPAPESP